MSTEGLRPEADKGFHRVDEQPDPSYLIRGMEQTAGFPAVVELRARERAHLAPRPGDALLDVGCGIGDVARSVAAAVAPNGRVVGIDASESMLAVARQRAAADGLQATFRAGDAMALDEPDESFDLCRSERVLQWLPDLTAAVGEMVRVLRPGGRLSLIDTDWRTFTVDLPDLELPLALSAALVREKGEPRTAGARLLNLCRDAGLVDLQAHAATHVWDRWDPDREAAPAGFFPLDVAFRGLEDQGLLDTATVDALVEQVESVARADRFFMTLTMIGVTARKP